METKGKNEKAKKCCNNLSNRSLAATAYARHNVKVSIFKM